MGRIEQDQKVLVFHPERWSEPFRATVVQLEDDQHVLVCAIDPVVGSGGEYLFDEGEYVVVEIAHIINDNR